MDHLKSDYINDIALQLDEDVYGANGELDDQEIRDRLMETIIDQCNYPVDGRVDVWQAANLILGVWKYKDRNLMNAIKEGCESASVPDRQSGN